MSERKLRLPLLIAVLAIFVFAAGSALAAAAKPGFGAGQNGRPSGLQQPMARPDDSKQPATIGTISSLSDTTIALAGKKGFGQEAQEVSYIVEAGSAKITKGFGANAQTLSFSDLKIGDMLQVFGTISGTSVTAESISLFGNPPAAVEANGLRQRQGFNADEQTDGNARANRPAPSEEKNGYGYGRPRQNENGDTDANNAKNGNGNLKQKKSNSNKQEANSNLKKSAAGAAGSAAPAKLWSKIFVPVKNFFGKIFKFGQQK